jgi:hypothetical protein
MLKNMPPETTNVVFGSEWHKIPLVLNFKESLEQHNSVIKHYGIIDGSRIYADKNKDSQ